MTRKKADASTHEAGTAHPEVPTEAIRHWRKHLARLGIDAPVHLKEIDELETLINERRWNEIDAIDFLSVFCRLSNAARDWKKKPGLDEGPKARRSLERIFKAAVGPKRGRPGAWIFDEKGELTDDRAVREQQLHSAIIVLDAWAAAKRKKPRETPTPGDLAAMRLRQRDPSIGLTGQAVLRERLFPEFEQFQAEADGDADGEAASAAFLAHWSMMGLWEGCSHLVAHYVERYAKQARPSVPAGLKRHFRLTYRTGRKAHK